jgi:hypothetical protein
MSFDYNILMFDPMTNLPIGACDHHQWFERYVVNQDDFRTLNYAGQPSINQRAPINGAGSVQMWIHGQQVHSSDPIYGWQVVLDPDRIDLTTENIFYKIVFNRPTRLVLPLIEVSYISRQDYCLKCSATGFLNDLKLGVGSAPFSEVTQATKLAQKALKWILTSRCPFYPTFVCAIKSYVGRKLGIQITDTDIQTAVVNALTNMQRVQQAQSTVQNLDPQEILKDIVNVTAAIDQQDPTIVRVNATVSNYSGQSAPIGFTLRMNG